MSYKIKRLNDRKYEVTWNPPIILKMIGIRSRTKILVDTNTLYPYRGNATHWYDQTKEKEYGVCRLLDKWINTEKYRNL